MRRRSWLGVGAAALVAAGCGGGDSTPEVPDGAVPDLAQKIEAELPARGVAVDEGSVECDGGLTPERRAEAECEFTVDGQPVGAAVRVASVKGENVRLEIVPEPRPVPQDTLEEDVAGQVGLAAAVEVDASCDGDLQAEAGSTTSCELSAGDEQRDFRVTVDSVEGGLVNYTVEPE